MSGGVWYMLMVSGASLVMSGACLVVFVVSGGVWRMSTLKGLYLGLPN